MFGSLFLGGALRSSLRMSLRRPVPIPVPLRRSLDADLDADLDAALVDSHEVFEGYPGESYLYLRGYRYRYGPDRRCNDIEIDISVADVSRCEDTKEDTGTEAEVEVVKARPDDASDKFSQLHAAIAALVGECRQERDAALVGECRQERDAAVALGEHIKGEALRLFDDNLRLRSKFNTRGALERIAFHASLNQCVPYSYGEGEGVQRTLDALAQQPGFSAIVKNEADARQLVSDHVVACARFLVSEVAKYLGGNDGVAVAVRARDYSRHELTAIVAYLKLQDTWENALKWREE
ncbi:hypothetical protein BZA05DRAFT_476780 [Tricharina praecox]|uniref:uncharacterized protein n=1 Tax=Tricharina praecox TaxID=43433 RepID=UPI00221F2829|nr:uncharacterized protein BZA05DRAFT_476780 [Tricharina praecox]KAI5844767.1 hypothetical protein BZA05DRAFT_476780 [Tricharina praecox]